MNGAGSAENDILLFEEIWGKRFMHCFAVLLKIMKNGHF